MPADAAKSDLGQWPAIITLVIFLITNLIVIFPFRIHIPRPLISFVHSTCVKTRILRASPDPLRRAYLPVNLNTAPLTAVLVLLASGATDGKDVRRGVLGADGVKPIDIMALFISLAYMSISLDAAGLFRFLAFWAARKGGSSGHKLFAYLYAWFLICGVIVGNDPVILSGTAFLAYFTRVSGIFPPSAWIYAQFSAANMASAVLVSSNPTNLVLSGAFSLSFVTYTSRLILPVVVSAIAVYPVLTFGLFRAPGLIPQTIELHFDRDEAGGQEGSAALVDKRGAIFGSVVLLLTLGALVGTSVIHVPVWWVTVPPALTMLARDAAHDWMQQPQTQTSGSLGLQNSSAQAYPLQDLSQEQSKSPAVETVSTRHPKTLCSLMVQWTAVFKRTFPTVVTVASRLPVALVPFAFLMFILVQSLASKGWVELLSSWWASWVEKTGVVGAVFGMGVVSCLFCNVCGTNIGATILLARVLQVHFQKDGDTISSASRTREREGAIYALALGSNYGAFTFSFSASLAGLLWRDILRQKGIHVRQMQFLRTNIPIVLVALVVGCATLLGEVYAW